MNYLEICKKVHRILRVDEQSPGSFPTAVAGQSGHLFEIVSCVNDAYRTILQRRPDWLFRSSEIVAGSLELLTSAGVMSLASIRSGWSVNYEAILPFHEGESRYINFAREPSSTQRSRVYFMPYEEYRGFHDSISLASIVNSTPTKFTIKPNGDLQFNVSGGLPTGYIFADFRLLIADLVADADVPIIPSHHHDVIVWGAVKQFMTTRDASSLYVKADSEYRAAINHLCNEQTPEYF